MPVKFNHTIVYARDSQSGNGVSPQTLSCQPACRDCSILDAFCHVARASLPLTLSVC
jgi:hypothetical protein